MDARWIVAVYPTRAAVDMYHIRSSASFTEICGVNKQHKRVRNTQAPRNQSVERFLPHFRFKQCPIAGDTCIVRVRGQCGVRDFGCLPHTST